MYAHVCWQTFSILFKCITYLIYKSFLLFLFIKDPLNAIRYVYFSAIKRSELTYTSSFAMILTVAQKLDLFCVKRSLCGL